MPNTKTDKSDKKVPDSLLGIKTLKFSGLLRLELNDKSSCTQFSIFNTDMLAVKRARLHIRSNK